MTDNLTAKTAQEMKVKIMDALEGMKKSHVERAHNTEDTVENRLEHTSKALVLTEALLVVNSITALV